MSVFGKVRSGGISATLAALALAGLWRFSAAAASYIDHGHYGFVTLDDAEAPGATGFSAELVGRDGRGRVRQALARAVPGGWQVFVGGWPAGVSGLSDLLLRVEGGAAGEIRLPGVVMAGGGRMDVALVVDDSFSMRKTDPLRLRVRALELFARIAAGRGYMATLTVVGFNRYPRLLLPPTPPGNIADFRAAMARLVAEGTTDLDAALDLAAATLAPLPESRKVVVVLSDGRDEPGRYEDAHRRLVAARIPVYTVGLSRLADRSTLERIASEAGGAFMFAPDMTRLEAIFQEIVLALHRTVLVEQCELQQEREIAVPVDDTMRLVAFTLDQGRDGMAQVRVPTAALPLQLRTATPATSHAECYLPAAGDWLASGAGMLSVTAESDLELVVFPDAAGAVEAQPCEVAALLMRGGEVVINDARISVVTTGSGAPQFLTPDASGAVFAGRVVPAGHGAQVWRVMAHGATIAGSRFQRLALAPRQVAATKRELLWAQPEPVAVGMLPGCEAGAEVAIAGRGKFSAELSLPQTIQGVLVNAQGDLPEGEALKLALKLSVQASARPGEYGGEVVVRVGRLPPAKVPLLVTVRTPQVRVMPPRLAWHEVVPGSVLTGMVNAVVVADDPMCRVAAVVQGVDRRSDVVRDTLLRTTTNTWPVVIDTTGAAGNLSGEIALSWGWGGVTVPWSIALALPPAPPAAAVVEPVVAEEIVETVAPEPEPEKDIMATGGTAAPLALAAAAPAHAAAARNYWRIALSALLVLLLLYLLWRMTDSDEQRLFKYYAASVALHLLVFILTLDLLLQTRVVSLEAVSPTLAVSISAVEQKLGISIAPPAGAVPLDERAGDAATAAKMAADAERARERRTLADLRLEAAAARGLEAVQMVQSEAQPAELREHQADTVRKDVVNPAAVQEIVAPEEVVVKAKCAESRTAEQGQRPVTQARGVAAGGAAARQAMTVAVGAAEAAAEVRVAGAAETAPAGEPLRAAETVAEMARRAPAAAEPGEAPAFAAKQTIGRAAEQGQRPVTQARGAAADGAAARQAMTVAVGAAEAAAEVRVTGAAETAPAGEPLRAAVAVAEMARRAPAAAALAAEPVEAPVFAPKQTAGQAAEQGQRPVTQARGVAAGGAAARQAMTVAVGTAEAAAEVRVTGAAEIAPAGEPLRAAVIAAEMARRAPAAAAPVAEPGEAPAFVPKQTAGRAAEQGQRPVTQARGVAAGGATARQAMTVAVGAAEAAAEVRVAGAAETAPAGEPLRAAVTAAEMTRRAPAAAAPAAEPGEAPAFAPKRVVGGEADSGLRNVSMQRVGAVPLPPTAGGRPPAVTAVPDVHEAVKPVKNTMLVATPDSSQPGARHDAAAGDLTIKTGVTGTGSVRATLAMAQYGGDWDCARTAMMFLSHQLRERTGMALLASDSVIRLDQPELMKLPFVYMTGHKDFVFSDAELVSLRLYLNEGGHLWIDDSTHYRDQTFDRAARRELARLLPGTEIVRLGADFGAWHTGYDLSAGYKGYAIPPGDKYRQDYIEGIMLGGRVAVVYTRNDYGDGLNIDPHTQPLRDSLTSLSPAEMQEGATRMGVNLTLYFLSQRGMVDMEFMHDAAGVMRRAADPSDARLPEGAVHALAGLAGAAAWFREEWGDAAEISDAGEGLEIRFKVADNEKVAFGVMIDPPLQIAVADFMAVNVESRLSCGARVALGCETAAGYFETAPFYVKPGRNVAYFSLAAQNFKNADTKWEYRASLPLPASVSKLNLLIYSPDDGAMRFSEPRIIRAAP